MIRDAKRLREWEKAYHRSEKTDYHHKLRLLEGLYAEARALGIFPLKDPFEGLQIKTRLAKALNCFKS